MDQATAGPVLCGVAQRQVAGRPSRKLAGRPAGLRLGSKIPRAPHSELRASCARDDDLRKSENQDKNTGRPTRMPSLQNQMSRDHTSLSLDPLDERYESRLKNYLFNGRGS